MKDYKAGYQSVHIPPERQLMGDSGRIGRTLHTHHFFNGLDVAKARMLIKD